MNEVQCILSRHRADIILTVSGRGNKLKRLYLNTNDAYKYRITLERKKNSQCTLGN